MQSGWTGGLLAGGMLQHSGSSSMCTVSFTTWSLGHPRGGWWAAVNDMRATGEPVWAHAGGGAALCRAPAVPHGELC